jgi:hypothetical protein
MLPPGTPPNNPVNEIRVAQGGIDVERVTSTWRVEQSNYKMNTATPEETRSMLVKTHLFIPGPMNLPDIASGSGSGAAAEHYRTTTKASATSRPEAKLKLAS